MTKLKAIWAWIKANPKPAANVALIVTVYALSRFLPHATLERQALEAIGAVLGIYGTRLTINSPSSAPSEIKVP